MGWELPASERLMNARDSSLGLECGQTAPGPRADLIPRLERNRTAVTAF